MSGTSDAILSNPAMTGNVIIRTALPSERAEIEALQWRASLANPGDREMLLAHPDAIEVPIEQIAAGDVYVAELDREMVGFAALKFETDGAAELDGLFVEPAMQRNGIGRLLIDHCVRVAKERNCSAVNVAANPHAEAFYFACGFVVVGSVEMRFGTAQTMRRVVPRDG